MSALAVLPVALVVVDAHGTVVWQNEQSVVLLGDASGGPLSRVATDADVTYVPLRREGSGTVRLVLVDGAADPDDARRPLPPLTRRQQQVLQLLARGLSTRRIAAELGIADDTARNHIRYLLSELGVHTRLEAVATAFRNGWL